MLPSLRSALTKTNINIHHPLRTLRPTSAHYFSSLAKSPEDLTAFIKGPKPVVVDFFATWCGPCAHISPVFEELEKKYPMLSFVKVDVDNSPEIVQQFGISSMPTFLFFDGKESAEKPVDTLIGASEKMLGSKVEKLAKGGK